MGATVYQCVEAMDNFEDLSVEPSSTCVLDLPVRDADTIIESVNKTGRGA
ncbi:MAG: hypothetical protein R3B46_05100 [Phycisphaerales bacterium]